MSAPNYSASISPQITQEAVRRNRWPDYFEMTKPRLSLLSVITAVFGYFAAQPPHNRLEFLALLVGTALAAGAAAVLNEWMEHREDGLMKRTAGRPIPSGAVTPGEALRWGLTLGTAGLLILWAGTNSYAMLLALTTLVTYLLIYTPLKKRTPWNTEIGAVPGALPPLIGWVTARQHLDSQAWYLFGLLFAWQVTHFMAISWNFREDYRRGGFRMLSLDDATGRRTSFRSLVWAILLGGITLIPVFAGWTGPFYAVGGSLISFWLFWRAWQFYCAPAGTRDRPARRLFIASIIHLPVFLLILTFDRYL